MIRPGKFSSLVPNLSFVWGLRVPQSYSPTAVSLQGHYPEASCLFLGNSLKFQAWPSGYANISRFAEPPSGCKAELCEFTTTTPRWGKLPRGCLCLEPRLLPGERLRKGDPVGSLGPALVPNYVRDFASKGELGDAWGPFLECETLDLRKSLE